MLIVCASHLVSKGQKGGQFHIDEEITWWKQMGGPGLLNHGGPLSEVVFDSSSQGECGLVVCIP